MVSPGLSRPFCSASSTIASASRSFTEPPGLKNSALAYTVTCAGGSRCSLTTGVLPMVSRMLSYRAMGLLRIRGRRPGLDAGTAKPHVTGRRACVPGRLATGGACPEMVLHSLLMPFWNTRSPPTVPGVDKFFFRGYIQSLYQDERIDVAAKAVAAVPGHDPHPIALSGGDP